MNHVFPGATAQALTLLADEALQHARVGGIVPDGHTEAQEDAHEILLLKIQYADAKIASFLDMAAGDRVIAYRERLRNGQHDVVAINDSYLPFSFAEMLPELEQGKHDVYQLLRLQGKHPATCTETLEVTQARSVERVLFELSPDDPAPLLKLQRRTFDAEDHPLAMQFLTLKPEHYRLHYSRMVLTEPVSQESLP